MGYVGVRADRKKYCFSRSQLLLPTLLFRKERILLLESLFLLKDISPGESLQAVSILVPSTESLNRVIQLKGTEKSCGSGEENERPTRDKNRKEQKGNGPITRMSSVVSKSNDKSVLLAVEGDLSPGTKDEAKAD
ncbi:hypothetical protein V1477_000290 [Vespula maculifrons]|uniref:Uncharacterized protein n=1 Tax=Vespula maculifrons TaxID=7453 RepID=A0ABD2D175_VESMC